MGKVIQAPYNSGKIKKKSAVVAVNLIIDTREQTPWEFDALPSDFVINTVQTDKLDAGDYTIVGYDLPGPDGIIIERKRGLNEINTNFGAQWDRFMRECERLSEYGSAHIIVEDDLSAAFDRYTEKYTGVNYPPAFFLKRTAQIQLRYGVQVHYASNRRYAQYLASYLFQNHVYEDWKLDG
jgi:ERCC4-type nuclease